MVKSNRETVSELKSNLYEDDQEIPQEQKLCVRYVKA